MEWRSCPLYDDCSSSQKGLEMQTITPDFMLAQLRLAAVAFLAYAGGKGWLTPADAGLLTALGTSLGPIIIPWAFSIYANLGTKKINTNSAAAIVANVEKTDPVSANTGAAAALTATRN